jgi:glyoxylase-like metal-dependent hydrolase (beta-lactamase superfamily II)
MIKALINEFAENTYIIKEKNEAVIIDPGAKIDEIEAFIKEEELEVKYVLLTHGHYDHIYTLNECLETFDCDVYVHEKARDFLFDPNLNLSSLSLHKINVKDKSKVKTFTENDTLKIKDQDIIINHNPGHTRGCCSYKYKHFIFSGDLIFQNGVGRTDLPTGSQTELEESINAFLHRFDDNNLVYPGHGGRSTILTFKNTNPYYKK